jgi:hypothetical protein
MIAPEIQYADTRNLPLEQIVAVCRANSWSSAEKPEMLHKAFLVSHSLATAWDANR